MKTVQNKTVEQRVGEWANRCRDLESTCRLWIAAAQAKDDRIEALELECQRLRHRVGRLSRSRMRAIADRSDTPYTPQRRKTFS